MAIKEKKVGPKALPQLNITEFSRIITNRGLKFLWSRAVVCPCRFGRQGEHYDPDCAYCVAGWQYVNPDAQRERYKTTSHTEVHAVFAGSALETDRTAQVTGPMVFGRGQLTVDGPIDVAYMDRFVGMEQQIPYQQTLLRAAGDEIAIGWLGRTSTAMESAFRYEPTQINYIVDEDQVVYYLGQHIRLSEVHYHKARQPVWASGEGPAVGKRFTVHYHCRPVWVCQTAPYGTQTSIGSERIKTKARPVQIPVTFDVLLDYLTDQRES